MLTDGEVSAVPMEKSHGRNFRLLVVNNSVSSMGASGFSIAIIWIAYSITGSTVLSGFADGMGALPLLLSFFFGAYVDSLVSKRNLSIVSSAARTASVFGLFIAFSSDSIFAEVFAIYSVAFVVGLTSDVLNSISASWTRQFLREPQYKKGTSAINGATSLGQGIGYSIAGAAIILGSAYAAYALAAVFAISIVPLFFIRNDATMEVSKKGTLQSSIKEGLSYIFGDNRLRTMLTLTLIVNVAFGAIGIFLVVLVQNRFSLPAIYYTTLALCIILGIFVGSLGGGKAKGKVGPYAISMILVIGLLFAYIGFGGSILPDFAVTFAIGLAIGLVNVVIMTALLKIVKQEMMARVMGAIKTFAVSLTFISGALGGALIGFFGLSGAFYLMGSIIVLSATLPVFFRDFYNIKV